MSQREASQRAKKPNVYSEYLYAGDFELSDSDEDDGGTFDAEEEEDMEFETVEFDEDSGGNELEQSSQESSNGFDDDDDVESNEVEVVEMEELEEEGEQDNNKTGKKKSKAKTPEDKKKEDKEKKEAKLKEIREFHGFVDNAVDEFTIKGFPKDYYPGPTNVPDDVSVEYAFFLFFGKVISKAVALTNLRMSRYRALFPKLKQRCPLTTYKEMTTYLCLHFARGQIRFSNQKMYWAKHQQYKGLLGNDFFKQTMGYQRFRNLSRFFTIKATWLTKRFNKLSKKHWKPYGKLSIDDNLELWKGKYGQKKIHKKKADKTGQVTWETADTSKFIYNILFEYDVRLGANDAISVSTKRFKLMEQAIPPGPYTIYIDAGDFGCFDHANLLANNGRKFIMCVRNGRDNFLWPHLQKGLKPFDWEHAVNPDMLALSYRPRKTAKCINFLTNVSGLTVNKDKTLYVKNTKEEGNYIQVTAPKVVSKYCTGHGFVDASKSIINRNRPKFRARNHWRSRVNSMLMKLIHNACIWFCYAIAQPGRLTLDQFIREVITRLVKTPPKLPRPVPMPSPTSQDIIFHQLTTIGGQGANKKKYCCMCNGQTRKECIVCPEREPMCDGLCSLQYHNKATTILCTGDEVKKKWQQMVTHQVKRIKRM